MDLIADVLLDREGIDPTAGARELEDLGTSVGGKVDRREPGLAHGRHVGETRGHPARARACAFEDVADGDRRGNPVRMRGVVFPAERMHDRADVDAIVGNPAGDHDVGARVQRLDDARGVDIGVGSDHAAANGGEVFVTGIHIDHRDPGRDDGVDLIEQVVSLDQCDARAGQSERASVLGNAPSRRAGVDATAVGDEPGASLAGKGHHLLHVLHGIRDIPKLGVLQLLALQQRHGRFGQKVEAQVIEFAAVEQFERRIDAVAPKTGASAESDLLLHLMDS